MTMRRRFTIAFVSSLGAFGSLGTDCLPEPPDICGPEDVTETCDHYGEVIVGVPPNCKCVMIDDVPVYASTGQADVMITLPQGWTLDGLSGSLDDALLLADTDVANASVAAQPLAITNQARQGNTVRLWLSGADETFLRVSGLENLRYRLRSTNLVVHATKPSGERVHQPLPANLYFPVTMSDDCTKRHLDGSQRNEFITTGVASTFDSPGC